MILRQPMLAVDAEDLETLTYPLLGSFKLDGFRAVVTPEGARTRTMLPIPNKHTQAKLSTLPHGLDGEVGVLGEDGAVNFRATQSALMSFEGEPAIRYFVFDLYDLDAPYAERYRSLRQKKRTLPDWVEVLGQRVMPNAAKVRAMFVEALEKGHEGLILRRADAPYKQNRSTLRESYLLKVKPYSDAEAKIVGMLPEFENTNTATRDERGYAKRSRKKAGLVQRERMGKFVVENTARWPSPFEIGTGFTHQDREAFWRDRAKIIGLFARFSYVTVGGYDVPRHCVFQGFRAKEDM